MFYLLLHSYFLAFRYFYICNKILKLSVCNFQWHSRKETSTGGTHFADYFAFDRSCAKSRTQMWAQIEIIFRLLID